MRVLIAVLLAGCATVSEPFSETVDAADYSQVELDIARGNVLVEVGSGDVIAIAGDSIGRAGGQSAAAEREAQNSWTVEERAPTLVVRTRSGHRRGTVDVDLLVPPAMDLAIVTQQGSVTLADVEGVHRIDGGRIQTIRLRGSVDLNSSFGGVDAEIYPYVDGVVNVDSNGGDVIVRLPFGGNYDVEILGDPDFEMFVSEFGFVGSIAQPGFFSGVVGDGSIRVRITAQGGSVQILEAF